MATSSEQIKTDIISALEEKWGYAIPDEVKKLIEAIAEGLYANLQLLDDLTGNPPSIGHR